MGYEGMGEGVELCFLVRKRFSQDFPKRGIIYIGKGKRVPKIMFKAVLRVFSGGWYLMKKLKGESGSE